MGIGVNQWRLVIGQFMRYSSVFDYMTCKSKKDNIFSNSERKYKAFILIAIILIGPQINNFNYWECKAIQWNNMMKSKNGNIKAPSLRKLHLNKGCSNFNNKIDDIKTIIDKFRPQIFSLANYDLKERP